MYKNPNASPKERAEDLLKKMTLDEKIDQMSFFPTISGIINKLANGEKVPSFCGTGGGQANIKDSEAVDKVFDYFRNDSRLGIPPLFALGCIHGVIHPKATVFPQCLSLACGFNKENIFKMADFIGKEAKAIGVRQVLAPNVDIPRDPRWGRTQETFGEDPFLSGELGVQYIKGVQQNKVAATAKHFVAYGLPESGLNLSPAHIGEREIREVMLEPFKKCIDAGVMSVMPSYNEIDGEPAHASEKLLRKILREELGFDGVTIADWGAINMTYRFHHAAASSCEAGEMAVKAGVDIEAPAMVCYGPEFKNKVKDGEIDEKLIDEAVLRILTLKFQLGLFEDERINKELEAKMHSKEAVELSLKLDEESILLLKNDGLLPLDEKKIGKVAVIGNNAKDLFIGNYITKTENCVSFYDGMVNRLGEDRVLYSAGCYPITTTDEMIADAVETAKKSDVVMLVLGDKTEIGGGVGGTEFKNDEVTKGEGYDTNDLNLLPSQKRLFDEISALNKPMLLVVYGGSPFAIEKQVEKANAFMFSFGGGEQNGNAFANLIFGDKTPSAKLAISFPRTTGHIPCHYNYKPSARGSFYCRPGSDEVSGRDYVLSNPSAWLPFGYGLSYTTLEYTDLTALVNDDGTVAVSVSVENKGDYEIDENVLLFLKAHWAPTTPFVKRLRNFCKVNLKPGERKTVDFLLEDKDFTYIDKNMKEARNKARYSVMIDNLTCEFDI